MKNLTAEQVRHLLNTPSTRTLAGLRDRAILAVLEATGVRVSELCALSRSDVDWELGSLRIPHLKSNVGNERTVPIHQHALDCLRMYLDRRGPGGVALLLGRLRQRITPRSVQRIVRGYAACIGLVGVTPHSLRHTFATLRMERGAPVPVIQSMLGHKNIQTTMGYAHTSAAWVRKVYEETSECTTK